MVRFGITIIDDFDDLERYQEAWADLLGRAAFASIFQSYQWNQIWWSCFGEDCEPFVLLALEDERLVGIAPLCIRKKKINGITEKVLTFVGADNLSSDYVDFIIDQESEGILDSFLISIKQNIARWSVFSWPNMPGFSVNRLRTEEYFKQRSYGVFTKFMYDAPCWQLGSSNHDADVLEKKGLKRKENALAKQGALSFEHVTDQPVAQELLSVLVQQHIKRWKGTEYPSLFNDPQQVKFFERLISELLESEILRFSVLKVNDTVAALHIGFAYRGSYLWYKPSYNQEFAEQSPGQVLLKNLFSYTAEHGLKEFDFGVGSEFFKYRFSNHIKKMYRLDIYRRTPSIVLAHLRHAIYEFKRKRKKRKQRRS